MSWNANGASHSYTFTYDGVNRMLDAIHGDDNKYTEKVTSYDKNGNIKALQRYGNGLIDNLTYTYNGNQLTKVEDTTGNAAGFSNGVSAANEYTYDNNGNLTKDSNKNISVITYNVLNLPSKVTFSDGSTITYSYAADGTKLRTVHTISGTTTQKDYCGSVVYENGVQKMLLTEEGYVDLSASTPTYYYYLKDHQGNNRVVINSSGVVQETNHYYPFGGVFASTNVQPYKYNGKELDTKKGLNWYDYGARHYDATLGRWFVVDPLAEKMSAWSLYAYCFNNPIKLIDKDGKIPGPGDLFATKKEAAKDWGKYYNGASIIREKEMASTIYEVRVNGVLVGYSYSKPNEGSAHSVNPSSPPNYEKVSGTIHSHGNADSDSYNNIFSTKDIQDIEKTKKVGYLATPSGSLLQYDPVTNKTTTISKELPSDPKDKERVNNINPTDIPAEKERQVLKELHKHFNLYFSLWKNETIKWFIE